MARILTEKILTLIGAFIFVSILFFPPIRVSSSAPALEITDFLIPIFALIAIAKYKNWENKRLIYLIIGFGFYILLTIFINARYSEVRDYFEIVKLVKFASLIVIFSFISAEKFFSKWVKPVFVALVVFNLVHYFNLFNFNEFLGNYYLGGFRFEEFGLDSMGNPAQKRMLGFVGNPNNNAIVFMFFAIFLIPKKPDNYKGYIWYGVALIMVFLCQSRTVFIAIGPILIAYSIVRLVPIKRLLILACTTVLCFAISYQITKASVDVPSKVETTEAVTTTPNSTTYIESMVKGQFIGGSSMQGRYVIWKHLWGMIKEKPFFGHAPYKEYFYENELYFENELISMLWRYGFIGLGLYLFILFTIFRSSLKNIKNRFGVNLLLVLILILVAGLTNNPFAHKTVLVLFAITVGLNISQLRNPPEQAAE